MAPFWAKVVISLATVACVVLPHLYCTLCNRKKLQQWTNTLGRRQR